MERRKFLIGAGSLAAGSAAAVGTGAFSSVQANRGISVDTAGDANAYLTLEPVNSQYVDTSNGQIEIDARSLNKNASTTFDAFTITNGGTEDVRVFVDVTDVPSGYGMSGFTGPDEEPASMVSESGAPGAVSNSDGVILEPGASITFTAAFDVGTPDSYGGTMRVYAVSDDAQGSLSDDSPDDANNDVPTISNSS